MERVVLVDGSNLVYRAFYGLPSTLRSASGEPTNAIFGFANMFRKLFAGKTPAFGAVVFDAPGGNFREDMYADYKGNRESMPRDLASQLDGVFEVCKAHGFKVIRQSGVEADDVIGTLARQARDAGNEVFIVSSDKDFGQLVDERVKMLDTMKDVVFDADLVAIKWGVRPEQMIDYLALVGDKSDNVPGVAGIGDKSAVQLLADFGTVKGVYEAVDSPDHGGIKGRQLTALQANRDMAMLSLDLVTIRQHLELPVGLADLQIDPPDGVALNALYRDYQFYSLLDHDAHEALSAGGEESDYGVLSDLGELKTFIATATAVTPIAVLPIFDEEAPAVAPLLGLALCIEPGKARYVPFNAKTRTILDVWLTDPEAPRTGFDIKALYRGLMREGVAFAGAAFDVRLASFLTDPTRIIPHRLDQLARDFLQQTTRPAKEIIGVGKKLIRFSEVPAGELAAWACHLVDTIAALHPILRDRIAADGNEALMYELDLPLSKVLGDMELAGILADQVELKALGIEFRGRLETYEKEIWQLAGREFNIGSPKQLAEILFDDLGLPPGKKTKTGYSTDAEVLEKLASQHEIAKVIVNHRKLAKLINTYTDVLQRSVNEQTGRIHATFNQSSGATGRLISTDPDLQRTPIHTPEGRRIREAFIAPPGFKLVVADWSQIELRLLAHVTKDERLCEAFRVGDDVHRRTAGQIFEVAPADVTYEQRNIGKTINFATIYGQGATSLAQMIGIEVKDARRYIAAYFKYYGGVRTWLDETTSAALTKGWVETIYQRRRYIPELLSNSNMERQIGIRQACNHPIQGSAADLCKKVMLEVEKRLRGAGLETRMLLQIHDELVFEAPEDEVEQVVALVKDAMEHHEPLDVPLVADVGVGPNWGEAKG